MFSPQNSISICLFVQDISLSKTLDLIDQDKFFKHLR